MTIIGDEERLTGDEQYPVTIPVIVREGDGRGRSGWYVAYGESDVDVQVTNTTILLRLKIEDSMWVKS